MRRNRNALILAAALFVLIGGAAAFFLFGPSPEAPAPSGSPTPTPESHTLLSLERDAVDSLEITLPDSDPFTVYADGRAEPVAPAAQGFSYDAAKIDTLFQNTLELTSEKKVAEAGGAEYGLDAPSASVSVKLKDGTEQRITLGRTNPTNTGVYLRLRGDESVYLLPKVKADTLTRPESGYRVLTFLPEPNEEGTYYFTKLEWLQGGSGVRIVRRSLEELETLSASSSAYLMQLPYEADANDMFLEQEVLPLLGQLNPSEVVEDDPEDLSAYGLDEPTVLTLEDDQGWSGTLLVGGAHPDGGRYVQLPGISAVLRDRSGDYSFLELDALQLRSRLIFIHNIKDVVRAEFTIGGQTHTLMLDDRAATDTEAESFTASLDGGEILPNNARRIYTRLISFMMEGENEDPGGETVYTQTLTMRDGGVHSLELRAINDRHLAAVIDGEAMGFYVNIKQVQEIEQALAINAAGDEIPL